MIHRLLESDQRLWLSRSWTTRAPRQGEATDAYTYVTREEFEARRDAGAFLEWAEILGELYGTPWPSPPAGSDVVLEIDVQGARQVLSKRPDAICVLLLAPSEDVQVARLSGRGDPDDHIRRRVELGRRETEEARHIAGHVIVNDDLEATVLQLLAIIEAGRAAG